MDKSLVVGMGEIGKAVAEVIGECKTYDIKDKAVLYDEQHPIEVDVLHICFPYSETFIEDVKHYQKIFKPKHTIIYSTVKIGTTKQLNAVHSPVEGRHPDLELSIRQMVRWIGGPDGQFFANLFTDVGIKSRLVPDSNFTEFLKLRSTAKYGINLMWADYEKMVADKLDMDFDLLKEFDTEYNRLYRELGETWAQRYILDPPEGKIGGHCVVPNAKLLNEQYPNEWLQELENYG